LEKVKRSTEKEMQAKSTEGVADDRSFKREARLMIKSGESLTLSQSSLRKRRDVVKEMGE
jgi:hypothetical protein